MKIDDKQVRGLRKVTRQCCTGMCRIKKLLCFSLKRAVKFFVFFFFSILALYSGLFQILNETITTDLISEDIFGSSKFGFKFLHVIYDANVANKQRKLIAHQLPSRA